MQIEEAIEKLKGATKKPIIDILRIFEKEGIENFIITRKIYLDTVLNELEKKDAVINMMTGWLYAEDTGFGYGALKDINTPEKIQEFFYKKVSDNE